MLFSLLYLTVLATAVSGFLPGLISAAFVLAIICYTFGLRAPRHRNTPVGPIRIRHLYEDQKFIMKHVMSVLLCATIVTATLFFYIAASHIYSMACPQGA
jgi:hypothetical protein